MPEVHRHVLERVLASFFVGVLAPHLRHERADEVPQVPLVLRGRVEDLAGELGRVGLRVVARAEQLDELEALRGRQGQVGGAELHDHLGGGRVVLA